MPSTARRVALLAVVALVVLAGCSALGQDPTREDRAVEALERSQERLDEVDSYRTDGELRVDAESDGRTERIRVEVDGAVDLDAERMRTNATVDGETTATYLVGRTTYRQCPDPWGGWAVEEVEDAEDWADLTPAAGPLSVLESGSLYWNGTETVDGREAVLLVGHPPASALDETQSGFGSALGGGPNVEDPTVELWIDAETGLPIESRIEFDVSGRDGSADASATMRYSAYDEPVSIEVPGEAYDDPYELGCPGS
ncbi:hypothetical protein [Salinilacihabitans rarus]|uniref:hypothetical protein n=1 Tax=Salinilacihabitans rarus TaxID=2961596 RepID=UPI0020C8C0A7|nr:hypothetical protein [Salinilacihabitans rarus]